MAEADVTAAVSSALQEASTDPGNNMTSKDATEITPAVSKEVNKEVNAIVTNITNQEPWYQSRVLIGAGVSAIGQLIKIVDNQWELSPEDQDAIVGTVISLISLAGVLFAIYGRVTAKKPLFVQ